MTPRLLGLRSLLLGMGALALSACADQPERRVVAAPSDALSGYRNDLKSSDDTYQTRYNPQEAAAVQHHVENVLDKNLIADLDLVIFINKHGEGETAQHAYLFTTDKGGELTYLDTWLVSTGREGQEISPKGESKFTTTPTGTFQFDIGHFSRIHKSNAWESDMPWAMFLRTRSGGPTSGVALHAALDKYVHNLGQRASAGCIRLQPSNAEKLYKLLQTKYYGSVPTMYPDGIGARRGSGHTSGARAVVIIEDINPDKLLAGADGTPTAYNQ